MTSASALVPPTISTTWCAWIIVSIHSESRFRFQFDALVNVTLPLHPKNPPGRQKNFIHPTIHSTDFPHKVDSKQFRTLTLRLSERYEHARQNLLFALTMIFSRTMSVGILRRVRELGSRGTRVWSRDSLPPDLHIVLDPFLHGISTSSDDS